MAKRKTSNRQFRPAGMPQVSLLLLLLLLLLATPVRQAFRYEIDDYLPSRRVLEITERYMFASNKGPPLLEQGPATIDVEMTASLSSSVNRSYPVSVAVYKVAESHHHDALLGMCGEYSVQEYNPWATHTSVVLFEPSFVKVLDANKGPDSIRYVYEVGISLPYSVQSEGWYNVAIQFCGPDRVYDDDYRDAKVQTEKVQAFAWGDVSFRNPFGYLPGELHGFLPFEGARMVALFIFGLYYCYFYISYWKYNLPLHHAIVAVYAISLLEAVLWYAAYQDLNLSGVPYCCPFPATVIAACVVQVLRETVSRTLLLVVTLGFGIVRPKLLGSEWVVISAVTVLYLISALAYQIAQIIVYNDIKNNSLDVVSGYRLPLMVTNAVFLVWIYFSLETTMRILREFKQEFKLTLYNRLFYVILSFTILFVVILVLEELDSFGFLEWPWKFACLQQISGEILFFAIFICVAVICQPSRSSIHLAYSQQLPTDDVDDEDEDEGIEARDGLADENDYDNLPPVLPSDGQVGGRHIAINRNGKSNVVNPMVANGINSINNYRQSHVRSSMMQEEDHDFDEVFGEDPMVEMTEKRRIGSL